MAKRERLSRLNPAYLAARHGGVVFLCLSVGTAAGLIWALLGVPAMYRSEAAKSFVVHPAAAMDDINWNDKLEDWRSLFLNYENQPPLNSNLRFRAKLAMTLNEQWPDSFLADELAKFEPVRTYAPMSPRIWGVASRLGLVSGEETANLTRRDLAANLDFQSLAKIVSDLDPPRNAPNWDFSFFRNPGGDSPAEYLVVRPGPDDRFFGVFYRLHETLYPGSPPESPAEAWRTAVEELTARLDREAAFAGGGGFGPQAKRELARELQAIPALLANFLYADPFELYGSHPATDVWAESWRQGLDLRLRPGRAGGAVDVAMTLSSPPLRRGRDTLSGRLPALATALAMDTLEAEEKLAAPAAQQQRQPAPAPAPVQPAAEPKPEPAIRAPEPEPQPEPAANTAGFDAEEAADRERILPQEERVRLAALDSNAAKLRLDVFWAENDGLVRETVAARQRADRMRERYEDAALAAEGAAPALPLAAVKLMLARDEIAENLALLLQSGTEDHPLVRQARRELAAINDLLAAMDLDALRAREQEASETRLRNMYLEWDGAENAWSALEQRRRRRAATGETLLAELQSRERHLSEAEAELARMREDATARTAAREKLRTAAARPPEPARRRVAPPGAAEPPPKPATAVAAQPSHPVIGFDPTPAFIPVIRKQPPWEWAVAGAVAGLLLGGIILLAREMLATRFRNTYQARRLVNMPLLAALPAYSPKSLREAAKTMQGEVGGKGNRLSFVPLAVDFVDPPATGRRGAIRRSTAKRRMWPWLAGLLALALAGLAYYQSQRMRTGEAPEFAGPPVSPTAADYQAWRGAGPGRTGGK